MHFRVLVFSDNKDPTFTSVTKIRRERDGITSSWPQLAVSFRLILVEIYLIFIFGQKDPTCTSVTGAKIRRERDGITSSWPLTALSQFW